MATKMQILFDGFSDLAEKIDRANGDLHAAVDEALNEAQSKVQSNLTTAAASYANKGGGLKGYATGAMYRTIVDDRKVSWEGSIATVDAGFRIRAKGGLHSIFVMYGTPKMQKDQKVYNAIKGTKTKKEIAELQKRIMLEHLKL